MFVQAKKTKKWKVSVLPSSPTFVASRGHPERKFSRRFPNYLFPFPCRLNEYQLLLRYSGVRASIVNSALVTKTFGF